MVYRQRDKITIINLQGEKEKVLFDELEQVILNKPSNIVYCERDRVLQGIISMGDICRARDKGNNFVMVNTQFMCATGMSYMHVKKVFEENKYINALPVLDKDGRLLGNWIRWDDINCTEQEWGGYGIRNGRIPCRLFVQMMCFKKSRKYSTFVMII